MQQIPTGWVSQRKPIGKLKICGVIVSVDLGEAETMEERMAICRIDGDLTEEEAERVTLAEHRLRNTP